MADRRHLGFFDGLRGVAAFAVVLYHISGHERMQELMAALPTPLVEWGFQYGMLGVAVFFVLSGFVISYSLDRWRMGSNDKDAERRRKPAAVFLVKRLVRLTPPYYAAITFALMAAVGAALESGEPYEPGLAPFSVGRLVAHLFYVQEILGYLNFNDVFWTLAIELQFYIALVVVWLIKEPIEARWGRGAGLGVIVASAVAGLAWPLELAMVEGRSPWFMALWYSFASGVMLYLTWQGRLPRWVVVAYSAMLVAAAAGGGPNPGFLLATVTTTTAILAAMELGRLDQWLTIRPFRFLGRISYSLYLIHTPILGAVFTVMAAMGPANVWWDLMSMSAGVVASLVLSTIFYRLFELPAIQLSKRVRPRSRVPEMARTGI